MEASDSPSWIHRRTPSVVLRGEAAALGLEERQRFLSIFGGNFSWSTPLIMIFFPCPPSTHAKDLL